MSESVGGIRGGVGGRERRLPPDVRSTHQTEAEAPQALKEEVDKRGPDSVCACNCVEFGSAGSPCRHGKSDFYMRT